MLIPLLITLVSTSPIEVPSIHVDEPSETPTSHTFSVSVEPQQGQGKTLAEALQETPGVDVLRLGARGNGVDVRIRALGGNHVGIVIDGIPIQDTGFRQFDLSLLPADNIARIDIGRGSGPLHLMVPIGGMLNIHTTLPTGKTTYGAHTGFGTQLARSTGFYLEQPWKKGGWRISSTYQGTQGNFPFYDDNNTRYNSNDDRIRLRRNNQSDRVVLHTRLYQPFKKADMHLITLTALDFRGVPGPSYAETLHTSSKNIFQSVRLAATDIHINKHLTLQAGGDISASGRFFGDPQHETSLATQKYQTWLLQGGLDQRADIRVKQFQMAAALRNDVAWFHGINHGQTQDRGRTQTQGGLQAIWYPHKNIQWDVVLQGGVMHEYASSQSTHWALSPQTGFRATHGPCHIRAHGGLFHRFATLAERFGDGALVLENPNIHPEQGWHTDAGGACKITSERFGTYSIDVSGFFIDARELVRMVQVSQQAYRYENLGKTRIHGIEMATVLTPMRWLEMRLGYTWTHAINRSDILGEHNQPAATIVPHLLTAALTLRYQDASFSYRVAYRSQSTLDRAALVHIPQRHQHDLVIRMPFAKEWAITMELLNLTGEVFHRGATGTAPEALKDIVGYPWPGQTGFVSIQWQH